MIGWWSEQPWQLRYGVSLLLIGISTGLYFLAGIIWPYGWVMGGIMFLLGGPSDSEKKGYHF